MSLPPHIHDPILSTKPCWIAERCPTLITNELTASVLIAFLRCRKVLYSSPCGLDGESHGAFVLLKTYTINDYYDT